MEQLVENYGERCGTKWSSKWKILELFDYIKMWKIWCKFVEEYGALSGKFWSFFDPI